MTFDKIKAVIADELGIDERYISPASSFVSLGADSMDMASLILAFEDELGMEIPQDDVGKLITVMDVVNYVDQTSARV